MLNTRIVSRVTVALLLSAVFGSLVWGVSRSEGRLPIRVRDDGTSLPTASITPGDSKPTHNVITARGPDMAKLAQDLIENLPLAQGVQNAELHCGKEYPYVCIQTYRTPDSYQNVSTFYKSFLQSEEWLLLGDQPLVIEGRGLTFTRKEKVDTITIRLILLVNLQSEPGGTYVSADLRPWPDATDIALFPEASDVTTRWPGQSADGAPYRLTTYEAHSSNQDILLYYKEKMMQQGWDLQVETDSRVVFHYLLATRTVLGGAVTIDVEPGVNHQTQVTISARGSDFLGVEP